MTSNTGVFQNLNTTQLENFEAACTEKRYVAGEELIERGKHGEHVFFLVEGRLRVFIADRTERDLAVLEAPAVVGEMELLTGRPRSATVAAVTDVRVLQIAFDVMRKRIADGDVATLKIVSNIATVLAHRLGATLDQLVTIEERNEVRADELQDFRTKLFSDWSV